MMEGIVDILTNNDELNFLKDFYEGRELLCLLLVIGCSDVCYPLCIKIDMIVKQFLIDAMKIRTTESE